METVQITVTKVYQAKELCPIGKTLSLHGMNIFLDHVLNCDNCKIPKVSTTLEHKTKED